MSNISSLVRQAIKTRLSNNINGFNAKYSAIQSVYGTPSITIDWSNTSQNFAWGRIPPDLMEETTNFIYPLLDISTERGQQDPAQQRIKFMQFSGNILGVIEVHLTWDQEAATDFETWPDAVIDAMYSSINDPSIANNWGAGIVYNGDLNWAKGQIILGGENWRRTCLFTASYKVIL